MNATLFIETSGSYCSLALRAGGEDFVESRLLNRSHNENVLLMIDSLYARADLDRLATNVIGFSAGPGSFTGVRIGAAVSQAIAFAADARVVPIESSLVLTMTAARQFQKKEWLAIIKSRKNLFYCTHYSAGSSMGLPIHETQLFDSSPAWLREITEPIGMVGDRPPWLEDHWVDVHYSGVYPEANSVLDLVERIHREGNSRSAEHALPIYLEADSPWVKESDRNI